MSKLGVLFWRKIFESGDAKRLSRQMQDLSDLVIKKDIPYLPDGDRGHLLDVYRLPDTDETAPVIINIHGGGLFASYKEVTANFNYEWARRGYCVVSLSYRRIPEITLLHQIGDVMAALRFLKTHAEELGLNLDHCYMTGDSAGALLSLFALSLEGSAKLQEVFGVEGSGIRFSAAGMISIMLDTQRKDLMRAISNVVTGKEDADKPYLPYLLDPTLLLKETQLPPLYLVTSAEDLIRKDSLKFDRMLTEIGAVHTLKSFEKGTEQKLVHVFSVSYPMYPESKEVLKEMDAFFREQEGEKI